jgi:hypothetical protein
MGVQASSKAYATTNAAVMRLWFKFHNILKKYGLTREAYEEKLRRQDYRCRICRTLMAEPYVDHDHETNKFVICYARTAMQPLGMSKRVCS